MIRPRRGLACEQEPPPIGLRTGKEAESHSEQIRRLRADEEALPLVPAQTPAPRAAQRPTLPGFEVGWEAGTVSATRPPYGRSATNAVSDPPAPPSMLPQATGPP